MSKLDLQYVINRRESKQTQETDDWIASVGLDARTFANTHIRLLQAQQQAHILLTQHVDLLNYRQHEALENFQQQMADKRKRDRLRPNAANHVLNICAKINRKLFRQYRHITQA